MSANPVSLIKEFKKTCAYAAQLPESVRRAEVLDENFLHGVKHVKKGNRTEIRVTGNDSFSEAYQMLAEGLQKILVLNFANAKTPGGGVTQGAVAQEECLCRQSSLYLSLTNDSAFPFYKRGVRDVYQSENFGEIPQIFSDCSLYSPEVCVFKNAKLEEITPYQVSVVTSAAPVNLSGFSGVFHGILGKKKKFYHSEEYKQVLQRRILSILDTAEHFGHKNLVLGAFGCGAFANDPKLVAGIFKECLSCYEFEQVRFAVLAGGETGKRNFQAFQEIFQR